MTNVHGSYKSVRARVRGWARPIASLAATPFFQRSDGMDETEADLSESKLPEPLIHFLTQLDNKLTTILGLLATDDLVQDFPMRLDTVSVSGANLSFTMNAKVQPGQHLEVVLLLSRMPVVMASAMGPVRPDNDPEFGSIYSMDLARLREEDRDAIIRFVFQQERRDIRSRWD